MGDDCSLILSTRQNSAGLEKRRKFKNDAIFLIDRTVIVLNRSRLIIKSSISAFVKRIQNFQIAISLVACVNIYSTIGN